MQDGRFGFGGAIGPLPQSEQDMALVAGQQARGATPPTDNTASLEAPDVAAAREQATARSMEGAPLAEIPAALRPAYEARQKAREEALLAPPEEDSPGLISRIFHGAVEAGVGVLQADTKDVTSLVGRATTRIVDNASELVVGGGAEIVKKVMDLTGGPKTQAGRNFMAWYDHRREINPLQFGDDFRNKYFEAPETWYGKLGEDAAVLVGGFIATRSAGAAAEAGPVTAFLSKGPAAVKTALTNAYAAGVAEGVFFEGDMGRFADLLNNAGDILPEGTPAFVTEGMDKLAFDWMSTDMDDSVFEARAKNFLEGFTLEGASELVIGAYKAVRGMAELNVARRANKSVADQTVQENIERIADGVARVEKWKDEGGGKTWRVERNPDGSADLILREGTQEVDDAFTRDAAELVDERDVEIINNVRGDEDAGLYHVTTNLDAVTEQGLRPRRELGAEGLGGGPDKTVSVTYSQTHAQRIEETLRIAARAARDEIDVDGILNYYDSRGALDVPEFVGQKLGAPAEVRGDIVELEGWIKENFSTGAGDENSLYRLVQDLDRVLDDVSPDQGVGLESVGLFGSREKMAQIDPEKIGMVSVEARKGAKARSVPFEAELQLDPGDVRVITDAGPVTRAENRMRFETPEEAANVAATLEDLQRTAERGPGLSPQDAEVWQETANTAMDLFREGASLDEILRVVDDAPINLKYVHNSREAQAAVASLAEVFDFGDVGTITHDMTRKMAADIIPGADVEDVLRFAAALDTSTKPLAAKVMALRGHVLGLAKAARNFAATAETLTGEARTLAMTRLGNKLDELTQLVTSDRNIGSNTARALEIRKARTGTRGVSKFEEPLTKIRDAKEALEAAQETLAQARTSGDPKAVTAAEAKVSSLADEAARLMDQELSSGLEGARRREGVSASQIPEGEPKGAGQATLAQEAGEAPLEARVATLSKQMDEALTAARERQAAVAAREGLDAPFAPAGPVVFSDMTTDEIDAMARMIFMAGNDPIEVLRQMSIPPQRALARSNVPFLHAPELTGFQKATRAVHFYRVNAMLSGLKTNAINMSSNLLVAATRPIELMLGGMGTLDGAAVREGADMFVNNFRHLGDGWRMAKKAFKSGDTIITPGVRHTDHAFGSWSSAGPVKMLENIISIPGRFLMAADEFAMQINYRSYLRAGLLRQGRGRGLEGAALADWVETHMRYGFGQKGEGLMQPAIDYARTNTFKNELGPQGQKFDDWVGNSEVMSAVLPFRRTPLNIVNYGWDRFPGLNAMRREFRADWSGANGLRKKQEAIGKFTFGAMAYSTAASLVLSGHLTGGGPPAGHPDRKSWLAAHQPYSLTVPGTDVRLDVKRLDPVLTPLSIMADLVEASGELDEEGYVEGAMAIVLTLASTTSDRSFFSTFAEFMEAVTNGDGTGAQASRFLANFGGSFVPNLANQLNPDDQYRDARNLVDVLKSKLPYYSTQVEPHRNFFGAPVQKPAGLLNRGFNPMTISVGVDVDEKLARELYEAGAQMSMPSPMKRYGKGDRSVSLDLRERGRWENTARNQKPDQSPYDRWMELMGSKGPGGRTTMQRILRAADTDQWINGDAAERRIIVAGILSSQREIAWQKMLQEYPSLRHEIVFAQQMAGLKEVTSDPDTHQQMRDKFGLDERGRWTKLRNNLSDFVSGEE